MVTDNTHLPNRRHVIGGMGAAFLGALALRGHSVVADAPAHFTHGVASGDPLEDRVILWTRVLPGSGERDTVDVAWQVASDEGFLNLISSGTAQAAPKSDYTVKVDAAGLEAGQAYFYRFIAAGVTSMVGRTRTLPAQGADRVRLAVISCSNFPQGYFNAYQALAKRPVEAVLHLGDYIYEYQEGGYANADMIAKGRSVKPEHELLVLEDYRMRYGLYRTDPDLQAVHAAHPFICVWDDHEIANNTWRAGAQNHNDGEGDFEARKQAAIRAYYEWLPIRQAHADDKGKIYRTFNYGGLASVIMLDTRLVGRDRGLDYKTDMPLRTVAFNMAAEGGPKAVLDKDELAALPADAVEHKVVPFRMEGQTAVPMTDWAALQALDPKTLPEGYAYLPDGAKFKADILGASDRTMMGLEQEAWLEGELAASKAAGVPWQILGQQVVTGKVGIPNVPEEAIDWSKNTAVPRNSYKSFQGLRRMGLPMNLDAWDGYPAARERIFKSISTHACNAVFLAGDTHNAWAFNLANDAGEPIAVEFATHGISSPGLETYLPTDPKVMADALLAASPELVYTDTSRRGWTELDITQARIVAQWHFVSTVFEREFTTTAGPVAVAQAGDHTLKLEG